MNPDSLRRAHNRYRTRNTSAVLWLVALALGMGALSASAVAQDTVEGKRLYVSPPGQGQLSCSASSCHGPDPTANLNRVNSAANFPAVITAATQTVPAMAFLQNRFYPAQLANLAAFIADPRQPDQLPVATLSPAMVTFDPANLGTTSSVRIVTLTNTGVVPLQLRSIAINTDEFAYAVGNCAPTATLAVYSGCSMGITFTPKMVGLRTATLTLTHNGSPGITTLALSGTGKLADVATTRPMVEYRNVALDYYFITSRLSDIALLDSLADWRRTGKSFNVYASSVLGSAGINRYYFDQVAFGGSRGTHFYTLVAAEKDGLDRLNPRNVPTPGLPYNEGVDSYAFAPLVEGIGGVCAQGQIPVYRLFRGPTVFPDNANHRFTTDTAVYNSFVALGWDGEGVKFCVPN